MPNRLREEYPHIPWQRMAGMRDRLIHAYFGVDNRLVWDTVQQFIPSLIETVMQIVNEINKGQKD
ncbi:MAG: DUF86 domain-containing protein [Fidelibacterota bacterium]